MIEKILTVLAYTDPVCDRGDLDAAQRAAAGCDTSGTVIEPVNSIINVLIGLVGVVAVVMIIVGGINYTTSQGDAGKVKKAKDTILYGVIGLVIAILAFAIVNFVVAGIA